MRMFYSKSTRSFYPESLKKGYQSAGSWPNDAVEVTEDEWEAYGKLSPPEGMQRGGGEDGRPSWVPTPPSGLEALAASKRTTIANALGDALSEGMPYAMPDGTEDTVQMLSEDRQNLLGLAIEARDLKESGVTGPAQVFRAASNIRYPLTPDEAIALTDAALGHYKQLIQRSWDRKDAIGSALEAGDRESLEAIHW